MTMGEKTLRFFINTPKIVISTVIPPFCHHATWRVGPAWGVWWVKFSEKKFQLSSLPYSIYSLCPKKNVILEILEQIDLDCPCLFALLGANWLLHAYLHMQTCQIKQNAILLGTNFES
jgi:hypothetical protein